MGDDAYARLADAVGAHVLRLDASCRYRFVNRAVAESWGMEPDEFRGRTPRELGLPDAECALLEDVVGAVVAAADEVEIEVDLPPSRPNTSGRVVRAHGVPDAPTTSVAVDTVLVVLQDATGEARLDAAIGRDRAALRTQAGLYQAIVDHATEGIWVGDADFVTIFANRSLGALLGVPAADLIGQSALPYLADTQPETFDREPTPTMASTGDTRELALRRADGRSIRVQAVTSPLVDDDGEVIGALALFTDLTASRAASERQRLSEATFRTLADLVPIGIVDASIDGTDRYANRRTAQLHGRSYAGVPEDQRIQFVHPDDRDAIRDLWRRASGGEHAAPVRYRAITEDGSSRWLEVQMVPVLDAGGTVARVIEVFADAEHAVAAEAALAGDRDRALEASEVKSRFIARISHELRTPLNGIIGLSSALLEDELSPVQREGLTAIRASGDRLLDVLSDVMDLAELEAGRLRLRPTPMDPVAEARAVARRHEPAARAKGLDLRLEVAGPSPHLLGDARRLAGVLDHLVDNAVRYTTTGGIVVRVEVAPDDPGPSGAPDGATLTYRVTDTGTGIDPRDRDRVFAAFISARDEPGDDHDRAALGIPVSAALVALMGGTLDFSSAPGEGSAFWCTVHLPVVDGPAGPEESDLPDQVATGRLSALLAEDDEVNRTVARSILERLGFDVDTALDGVETVARASAERYAVILMDRQMPGRNGLEAARAIRSGDGPNRATPILALTAAAMSGDREECLEAGMDDFLAKPFTMAHLAEALGALGLPVNHGSATTPPLLDDARVEELRSIDGAAGLTLYEELRALFVDTGPTLLDDLRAALGRDDWTDAARRAHDLAGACSAIGATRCAALAERVETACAEQDRPRLARLVPELDRRLAETTTAL